MPNRRGFSKGGAALTGIVVAGLRRAEAREPSAGVSRTAPADGFGWGSWSNLLLAGAVEDLPSAVNFCANPPSDGLKDVEAPVLAHYAQFDFRVTGNALWTAHAMKGIGKRFTYYVYPHVSHSFFDSKNRQYDANMKKLAWARTLEFLRSPA